MSILVVGSVAFDDVTSPSGSVKNILGGAATYFSLAASYFTQVRVVAVVGEDFGPEQEKVFHQHGIDTRGLERANGQDFPLGRFLHRQPQRSEDGLHRPERLRDLSAPHSEGVRGHRVPLPGQYPAHVAGRCAPQDERRPPDRLRHHELLDQRHAQGTRRDAEAGQRPLDQRHRSEDARQRNQPAARRAQSAGHGSAGAGHQARRIWRHNLLPRRRVRHRSSSLPRSGAARSRK